MQILLITAILFIGVSILGFVFKKILDSGLFVQLNQDSTYRILKRIINATFAIAILSVIVYFVLMIREETKSQYIIQSATDVVDFQNWKPIDSQSEFPGCTTLNSVVSRTRTLTVIAKNSPSELYVEKHSSTGCSVKGHAIQGAMTISYPPPDDERTRCQINFIVPAESFQPDKPTNIAFKFLYYNAYRNKNDEWVSRRMSYKTFSYRFLIKFPAGSPWRSARIFLEKPGGGTPEILSQITNDDNQANLDWTSPTGMVFDVGTRLKIYFDWPPLNNIAP